MKNMFTRGCCVSAVLLISAALILRGAGPGPRPGEGHLAGLTARITLLDGTTKTAKLEGLGCTTSICSRVLIKGKESSGSEVKVWLDGISQIRDTSPTGASLIMKDGTQHRLSLLTDFRVLYLSGFFQRPEKLDLASVKSLEFLPSTK